MDAATLARAMGGTADYPNLVGPMNQAMIAANITTPQRAAMWCAQIGHESVGLRYMEEIASGAAYEGRADLGTPPPGGDLQLPATAAGADTSIAASKNWTVTIG